MAITFTMLSSHDLFVQNTKVQFTGVELSPISPTIELHGTSTGRHFHASLCSIRICHYQFLFAFSDSSAFSMAVQLLSVHIFYAVQWIDFLHWICLFVQFVCHRCIQRLDWDSDTSMFGVCSCTEDTKLFKEKTSYPNLIKDIALGQPPNTYLAKQYAWKCFGVESKGKICNKNASGKALFFALHVRGYLFRFCQSFRCGSSAVFSPG